MGVGTVNNSYQNKTAENKYKHESVSSVNKTLQQTNSERISSVIGKAKDSSGVSSAADNITNLGGPVKVATLGDDAPILTSKPFFGRPSVGLKPQTEDKPVIGLKPQTEDKPVIGLKPQTEDKPVIGLKPQTEDKPVIGLKPQTEDKPAVGLKPQTESKPAVTGIKKEIDLEKLQLPSFTMTSADKYAEGSDVKELAYALAAERNRYDADLSEYTVLKASGADNKITISKGENGGIIVNVDGQEQSFTASEARNLIIDGGAGNDSIIADDDVRNALNIVGGSGNDTIKTGSGKDFIMDNYGANTISAGAGDDKIIAGQLDAQVKDNRSWYEKLWDNITGKTFNTESSAAGNVIDGGDGDDYIEGGFGKDIINGGAGNDVIYGLGGDDSINGGDGRDYIDGGTGNDKINAGAGNDMIFGGKGNDVINGVSGNNVIVGGAGADVINSGAGTNSITTDGKDVIVSNSNDTVETVVPIDVPKNVYASGTEGYKARVNSDLDALASTRVGQQMLNGLKSAGKNVEIASTDGGNYCSYNTNGILKSDGTANRGSDSVVAYNRSRIKIGYEDWGERPPIVGMFHEMAHSYDAAKGILDDRMYNYDGTLAKNGDPGEVKGAELQAVGLDIGSSVNLNPEGISENDIRSFLGIDIRPHY